METLWEKVVFCFAKQIENLLYSLIFQGFLPLLFQARSSHPSCGFFINASPALAQSNPELSTFLCVLTPNCSQAVATLLQFPAGCSDPRVDLALEEAGLTPGLAAPRLLVGCLGDTQGAWLRDESPVALDEIDFRLFSLQEILLRWLQPAGRLTSAVQSIC